MKHISEQYNMNTCDAAGYVFHYMSVKANN